MLIDMFPALGSTIKSFSSVEVFYLVSIYYLETLRAGSGTFQTVFSYLEDPAISNLQLLVECIRAIASDKVFPLFLNCIQQQHTQEQFQVVMEAHQREKILERETEALMLKYCSRSLAARKVADKSIVSMAAAFPHICWNKNCISTLLHLVQTLASTVNKSMMVSQIICIVLTFKREFFRLQGAITLNCMMMRRTEENF